MDVLLEKDYYLRISDFDRYGRLLASSILDIFQDIAASHANDLGIGFSAMSSNDILWVLSKVKFEVFKQPSLYDTVHVKTWPLEPDRIVCTREYVITSDSGEVLVNGTSEWVVINSQTRKLVTIADIFPIKEGFVAEKLFEGKIKKVPDFELNSEPYITKTTFCDCDINGHINNTKYANYVFNALNLSKSESIKTFQIDYTHEVGADTELSIHLKYKNNEILVKGVGNDSEKKFSCHIILN